jgi:hypothetical protein
MPKAFAYPSDLATTVQRRLAELGRRQPALAAMTRLFEVAFYASLRTEESEPICCSITYINPQRPDPSPPERIVENRWRHMRLPEPIALTPSSLVKIAKSFDSDASSIAVYTQRAGQLQIWGAIDQRGWRSRFITRETEDGAEAPGLFECSIVGIGSLEVYQGYTLLAALRHGSIAVGFNDVLGEAGPVRRALQPAINDLVRRVREEVGPQTFQERTHWVESVTDHWTTALARVLLGIQRYGHGGAIVVTADATNAGLSIKYPIQYERLRDALVRFSSRTIERVSAEDRIHEEFLDAEQEEMPVDLYLRETVSRNHEGDTRDEITGSVAFIASLSRVDGAVVMDRALAVRGYGAVIDIGELPRTAWMAQDVAGSRGALRRIDPRTFGTRHQSMMRFVYSRPGSVGFVVSQDGDVRAMARVRGGVVVWDDIKLRLA